MILVLGPPSSDHLEDVSQCGPDVSNLNSVWQARVAINGNLPRVFSENAMISAAPRVSKMQLAAE